MSGHVELESLTAYWLGELPAAEADAVEKHYFACARCAAQLEWLAALADGVRVAVRAGLGMVVTAPFVEAMERAGMRLREYRADAGATLQCTIRADEDAVISRVRAPLAGAKRVDMLQKLEMGGVEHDEIRLEDVPFDPASGEVLFVPPTAVLRTRHRVRVRLVAVEESGERRLGEYLFDHTPS